MHKSQMQAGNLQEGEAVPQKLIQDTEMRLRNCCMYGGWHEGDKETAENCMDDRAEAVPSGHGTERV